MLWGDSPMEQTVANCRPLKVQGARMLGSKRHGLACSARPALSCRVLKWWKCLERYLGCARQNEMVLVHL